MKKKVIIYTRVSTDEQAENGVSLRTQLATLESYCRTKDWEVVATYSEDYTAWKGFDRPEYSKLNILLKENKNSIDYILFTQWSRFSRESTFGMNEIKRLRKLGIEPNAVEQWVDFTVPEHLYILSIYLAGPQVENDKLSLVVKKNMRQLLKEGRWLWKAPYGYLNNKKTKLIELNPDTCKLVELSFNMMSSGLHTAEEVRRYVKERGLSLTKQAFLSMLKNVLYTGKVKVPANDYEPEQIVEGLHPALISQSCFDSVQQVLFGRKKSYKGVTKSSETPLVGKLYCTECGRPMTGSGSKGNGGVYHYYHCQRKYGCKNSISAKKANEAFLEYLEQLQPKHEMLELYKRILEDVFKDGGKDREIEKVKLANEIKTIEERINTAAIKNLDGIWSDEQFKATTSVLENQKVNLKVRLNELKNIKPEFDGYISKTVTLLGNIKEYYQSTSWSTQKALVGSIFPEKIYFENNSYRTTKINSVLEHIFQVINELEKESSAQNAELVKFAPRRKILSNQFFLDIKLLSDTYLLIINH
jgi:DNA invertase Pin-like site-specific DNA recombinase